MSLLNDALRKKNIEHKKSEQVNQPILKTALTTNPVKLKTKGSPKLKIWFKLSACTGGVFFIALFLCWHLFFCADSASREEKPDNFFQTAQHMPEKAKPALNSEKAFENNSGLSSAPETKELKAKKVISANEISSKIDSPVKKKKISSKILTKDFFPQKKNKPGENSEKQVKAEEIFYKKALAYQKRNNFKQAIQMYREVLENNPGDQDALLNIGACYIKNSEFSNAIIYLNKLKILNTGSCDGLINLAVAQIELGRFNKALVCLDEAEALIKNPRFEIFLYRGLAFSRLNKSDQALKWYRKAEQILPKNSLLLFNMAILFDKQKIYSEAVKYYSACLGSPDLLLNKYKKAVEKRMLLINAFI